MGRRCRGHRVASGHFGLIENSAVSPARQIRLGGIASLDEFALVVLRALRCVGNKIVLHLPVICHVMQQSPSRASARREHVYAPKAGFCKIPLPERMRHHNSGLLLVGG